MTAIEAFQEWLDDIPELDGFIKNTGHWSSYDGSANKKYLSFQVTGGPSPREVDTEFAIAQLYLVSSKRGSTSEILPAAKAIREYAKGVPPQCHIVDVNAQGALRGPEPTEQGRQVVNLTFEIII